MRKKKRSGRKRRKGMDATCNATNRCCDDSEKATHHLYGSGHGFPGYHRIHGKSLSALSDVVTGLCVYTLKFPLSAHKDALRGTLLIMSRVTRDNRYAQRLGAGCIGTANTIGNSIECRIGVSTNRLNSG